MAVYDLEGEKIYVPIHLMKEIRHMVTAEWGPIEQIGCRLEGSDSNIKMHREIFDRLRGLRKIHPEKFETFRSLDLYDKGAELNCWMLLNEFCSYHRTLSIEDTRDWIIQWTDDLNRRTSNSTYGKLILSGNYILYYCRLEKSLCQASIY